MSSGSGAVKRVVVVDELRGLAILLMVFYHGVYDLVFIFDLKLDFFFTPFMHYLQVFIAGGFIILSGISCCFSRNNFKRGLIAFSLGMVLSAVTAVTIPEQIVMFGILHFLGSAMMLFALFRPLLEKIHPLLGVVLLFLLFRYTLYVPSGSIGYPPLTALLPPAWYQTGWLFPFGFPAPGFFSSDYFPIIPWIFLFFAASRFGSYFRPGRCPDFLFQSHLPWLAMIGRNTIWIYLLHQPILYGVFWVIFRLINVTA